MAQLLVSIITVVYNGEKYLEQTINSVVEQSYENIEYIIIDGGSKDGTLDIIKKYESHISYWVSEPDRGLYDAMNKGIKIASGELIGMINSDDWYEPNAVELVIKSYQRKPEKRIFHGDRYDVQENGTKTVRKFNPSTFKLKYYGMTYNHPSMFVSKKEYRTHLYNPNLKSHADYQFVLEAFLRDQSVFMYIPKALVNYRLQGISANMPIWESSKAVYELRRNLGFSVIESIFSFLFMRIVTVALNLKKI